MKKNRKSKKDISKKILLITIIILSIIFVVLLILSLNPIKILKGFHKKPKLIPIKDDCSLIMGNLLHQIKNNEDCKIRCDNECTIRELKYKNSSLIRGNQSCYKCDCYCI